MKNVVGDIVMVKLLSITVKGKTKTWCFEFEGDDQYIEEWREDGLEIDEIVGELRLFGEV